QQSLRESSQMIRFEKQDLPFAAPLETVRWRDASLPVFGAQSRIMATQARVEGRFSDGTAAIALQKTGQGATLYCGFLPGLTYFKPAMPLRPADRSSRDDSLTHLVPTRFHPAAAQLFASLADIERPVLASYPFVETTLIEAKQGTVVSLNNWSGAPAKNLSVTLNLPLTFQHASLASGKPIRLSRKNSQSVFTFNLDVADALIL